MIAENVIVENSPSPEISDYVFRCAESIGIDRLGGYIKVVFEDDMIGNFSGETDGDEDRVDIRISTQDQDDQSFKINIAHEFVHAVQILTGRLIHIGLTLDENGTLSYNHIFDGVEYKNLPYAKHPWEEEAYRYEEEIYESIESGSKTCAEVQSAIYPY